MPDKTAAESISAKAASDARHQAGRSRRKRFRVRCGTCDHRWVALYTPMPLFKSAKVLSSLHCPRCGQDASQIFCWEADAG